MDFILGPRGPLRAISVSKLAPCTDGVNQREAHVQLLKKRGNRSSVPQRPLWPQGDAQESAQPCYALPREYAVGIFGISSSVSQEPKSSV